MEKCTIHSVNYENTNYFCVYENSTEQVIDFFYFEEDAIKCMNFLNNDGAFAGFTPSFVLRKVSVPKEVNSKFAEL